jgi:hypothetical protein
VPRKPRSARSGDVPLAAPAKRPAAHERDPQPTRTTLMSTATIDPSLAYEHPELLVLELLQHALAAARQALAAPHPEILAKKDLGPLADECHIAMLIALHLDDLHTLILKYRATLETVALDAALPLDDELLR